MYDGQFLRNLIKIIELHGRWSYGGPVWTKAKAYQFCCRPPIANVIQNH